MSVPAAVEAVDFDDDTAVLGFDGRLSYWNGESLDARAFQLREPVQWLAAGGALESESFDLEIVDDRTLRRSGLTPNRFAARDAVHPGLPPLPPSFHEPWVDRLENAGTRETVEQGLADYYRGRVDLTTFVEEGYGSGAYRVGSPEDVRQEVIDIPTGAANAPAVYATPRNEYPGEVSVERLRVLTGFGAGDGGTSVDGLSMVPGGGGSADGGDPYRGANVVYAGGTSFGAGLIGGANAPLVRSNVPERIRQRGTFRVPTGGLALVFNWGNDHLRRLWVRRALVAAAPFDRVVDNVAGPASVPPAGDTGLPSRVADRVFEDSFRGSLYDYPAESDTETAVT